MESFLSTFCYFNHNRLCEMHGLPIIHSYQFYRFLLFISITYLAVWYLAYSISICHIKCPYYPSMLALLYGVLIQLLSSSSLLTSLVSFQILSIDASQHHRVHCMKTKPEIYFLISASLMDAIQQEQHNKYTATYNCTICNIIIKSAVAAQIKFLSSLL